MKISVALYLLAIILCGFGYWGYYTPAGKQRFDEMDSLYPLIAMVIGGVVLVISIILFIYNVNKQ